MVDKLGFLVYLLAAARLGLSHFNDFKHEPVMCNRLQSGPKVSDYLDTWHYLSNIQVFSKLPESFSNDTKQKNLARVSSIVWQKMNDL